LCFLPNIIAPFKYKRTKRVGHTAQLERGVSVLKMLTCRLVSTGSEMFLVAGFCEYGYARPTYIKIPDERL